MYPRRIARRLKRWLPSSTVPLVKKPSHCEPLESRLLLSINWTNRGSDNFAAAFGSNAESARMVVDQAIADWNSVILNFNHAGGGNTFNIMFTVADLGDSLRAQGGATSHDGERVPLTGSVTLDDNAGGSGWYVDPAPTDDSEFTTINGAFSATSAAGAFAGNDLYRTAAHEIGHCVGITGTGSGLLIDDYLTDLLVDDPNTSDPGNLFAYEFGGNVVATFTEADSGHIYEGPGIPGRPNIPFHPFSLMNPGRAASDNERKLIGDIEATILTQVYGYTVAYPSGVNNMMVNPNFASDVLTVNGYPGNSDDLIILEPGPAGMIRVKVGYFTEDVPLSEVNTIIVNGGDGNDIIRVESNFGRFTTLNGGTGGDIFDFSFANRDLDNILGPTRVNGNEGVDSIFIYDNNDAGPRTYTANAGAADGSISRPGWGILSFAGDTEWTTLNTTTGADTVAVRGTFPGNKLVLHSAGGQDLAIIGAASNGAQNVRGDVEVQNNPSFTTIVIDDTGNTTARTAFIENPNFGTLSGLAPATISWDNLDIQEIHVTTGSGNDGVNLRAISEKLFLKSSGGTDNILVGNTGVNGMNGITGQVTIGPNTGGALSNLTIDDLQNTAGRNFTWTASGNGYLIGGLPNTFKYEGIGLLRVYAGNGGDQFTLNAVKQSDLRIYGGGGYDFLNIDDRNIVANIDENLFYPTHVSRVSYPDQINPGATYTVTHSETESLEFLLPLAQNYTSIYGTPPGIAFGDASVIRGNSSNDVFVVVPRDGNGNSTLPTNLLIDGGGDADSISINDGSSVPTSYTFFNSATNIGQVGGFGGQIGVYNTVENLTVNAGGGNDTFNINDYHHGTALTINAGGGDDTANITPTTNHLADITNMSSFTFNGGNGSNDALKLFNGNSSVVWGYYIVPGAISTLQGGGGTRGFNNSATEYVSAIAGTQGDAFEIFGTSPGQTVELTGQGGNDIYRFSHLIGTTLQTIASPVIINGAGGADQISLYNGESNIGRIAHIMQNSVGAAPGDNIFAPGGSVHFNNVAGTITLTNGSGADTTYVAPNATAPLLIHGGNPGGAPGDTLNFAFGDVTGAIFTGAGTGAGGYTFTNRAPLNYTGIESTSMDISSPNVSATGINTNDPSPSAQRSNLALLAIEFGEALNIASLIAAGTIDSYVRLFQTTDTFTVGGAAPASSSAGTAVPWLDESRFQFDAPSATLYIDLTTDGFGGGNTTKLENARYELRITTSAFMDSYGNPLRDNDGTADGTLRIDRSYGSTTQDLFRLGGDLDGDADVDLNDLGTLSTYYGISGGGDCDGDGDTDLADLGLLSTNYGGVLPPPTVTTTAPTSTTPTNTDDSKPKVKKPKKNSPRAVFANRAIA